MLIHTVLRERELLHPDVKMGILLNDCEFSIESSTEQNRNDYLYSAWSKHFDVFKKSEQKIFIGMQSNLVLGIGTVKELLAGLDKFDIAMYSTAGGRFPQVNDAFFACNREVIEVVPFIKKQNCPLCAWILRAKNNGFKIGFVCDKILETRGK